MLTRMREALRRFEASPESDVWALGLIALFTLFGLFCAGVLS